jgi:hypothetical protein
VIITEQHMCMKRDIRHVLIFAHESENERGKERDLWWIERWSNHLVYHQNPTFLLLCVQRAMPPYFNTIA